LDRLLIVCSLAALLSAWGVWWMLPPGGLRKRAAGGVLAAVALGLWASILPGIGDWLANGAFYVLAGATMAAAVCAISFRNPVYCAIWFGLSLLGTAGLLLLIGAQFLAVATIVVYAGAILVTFLFVLMLAQPEGRAPYDRTSLQGKFAAVAGAMMVFVLTLTIAGSLGGNTDDVALTQAAAEAAPVNSETEPSPSGDAPAEKPHILAAEHVARLGGELFGRHLLAVEVVGALLFAALAGAAAIAAQRPIKTDHLSRKTGHGSAK
jgi:NADH-quinone oxidoreductase subunit J